MCLPIWWPCAGPQTSVRKMSMSKVPSRRLARGGFCFGIVDGLPSVEADGRLPTITCQASAPCRFYEPGFMLDFDCEDGNAKIGKTSRLGCGISKPGPGSTGPGSGISIPESVAPLGPACRRPGRSSDPGRKDL